MLCQKLGHEAFEALAFDPTWVGRNHVIDFCIKLIRKHWKWRNLSVTEYFPFPTMFQNLLVPYRRAEGDY